MESGHFYFIKNEFYNSLPDCGLMSNKGNELGRGGRPCHYCIKYNDYFWMIPISSKIDKYHAIYESKVQKRGFCDTIRFGYVNGKERAFLIQNCFPVTDKYIDSEYKLENGTISVTIPERMSHELNVLVRKVIRLHDKHINLTLTDLDRIIEFLKC